MEIRLRPQKSDFAEVNMAKSDKVMAKSFFVAAKSDLVVAKSVYLQTSPLPKQTSPPFRKNVLSGSVICRMK